MSTIPILTFILAVVTITWASNCQPRDYGASSIVCVCNSQFCDTLNPPSPQPAGKFLAFTSSKSGLRFSQQIGTFQNNASISLKRIKIQPNQVYQSILGWGGAFTDSAGLNINSLSQDTKNFLLNSYFSQQGLGYNFGRVPIGGTDFSSKQYSYDDGPEDPSLQNFKLAQEDNDLKIPLIKQAMEITGNQLKLIASAWTAPTWMKDTILGNSNIKKEFYQTWANYFIKFLESYQNAGINFWGITTGNEPSLALAGPFNKIGTVGWNPLNLVTWISDNLGPTLTQSQFKNVKILALDDQTIFLPILTAAVLSNKKVDEYVQGIAVHWYEDSKLTNPLLANAHRKFPNKFILTTESSKILQGASLELGGWKHAEQYANIMINDLSNYDAGWVDWNLALDLQGGPTYINNFLDAAIIVNSTSDEFYKQPIYYALGHFSKFVPPESKRVHIANLELLTNVHVIAFRRPDNGLAIVILNKSRFNHTVDIYDPSRGHIKAKIVKKSITTLLYW